MIIEDATEQSFGNIEAIRSATIVSCYFCIETFPAASVTEWADEYTTALCPRCGIDALIPGEHSAQDLADTCEKWFCTPAEFQGSITESAQ